ncbi:MAG: radical SAM protein [Chloroflexi bacterium]|nr:radical SAM protein [Chloroflexota bacterium]
MPSEYEASLLAGHPNPAADYALSPAVLFWEITRACALACRHCRAEAQPKRHPLELTTEQGFALVDEIARFRPSPILVITGGDPLMRRDLFDVAAHAVSRGLRTSLSPSVTALVTRDNLTRAYDAGVRHISFSLDGATPEVHDGFRGVEGAFERTLTAIKTAHEVGLTVQVNTTVSQRNHAQLEEMADIVGRSGAVQWDLFFLVPTGRARAEEMLSPQEHEEVYHWLYDLSHRATFRVKTTLGQPFRRVVLQRAAQDGVQADSVPTTNDGKGICFVSHLGEIYPSGFLPVRCGNVLTHSLVEVYQSHPIFLALRDPGHLKGKCGVCPFNACCGGCRARAYACTGDYLAAEPCCVYLTTSQDSAPSAPLAVSRR